jgi:hypothetical protein
MGSIHGDLSVMGLPDVVIWLANRQRTGKLTVARGGVHKQLLVLAGAVTQSACDDPRERLGQHLINFGYVNEHQLQAAFQTQQETGVPLGRVLVAGGALDNERLARVLNYKTRECILDAMDWEQGVFEFVDEEVLPSDLDTPTAPLLMEIHSEGTSRSSMWQEIRKVLPGPQTLLEVREPVPRDLNPLDLRLIEFAQAGRTVGETALEVRALDFHIFARFYDLALRGLVKARPPGTRPSRKVAQPDVLGPGSAVIPASREEVRADLRARMDRREFEDAFSLAQRILQKDPRNAEALSVIRTLEGRARAAPPRGLLTVHAVPRLVLARDQLDEYLLTSKERYVLSRVDGKRTLGQIIEVSPIHETELIGIVEAFVQRGFVVL